MGLSTPSHACRKEWLGYMYSWRHGVKKEHSATRPKMEIGSNLHVIRRWHSFPARSQKVYQNGLVTEHLMIIIFL